MLYVKMKNLHILKKNKWNSAVICILLILLISAILHRLQLDAPGQHYTKSVLIHFEILSVISIMLMTLVNVILIFKYLILKQWRRLLVTGGITIVSVVVLIAVMAIDAPTLIYMT